MIERYEDEEIAIIWNRQAEIGRWFRVEIARMEAVCGSDAAEALRLVGCPDAARVAEIEATTKHEVVAFLRALDERILSFWLEDGRATQLRQWLHFGLTSSDVTDTGLGLALKDTNQALSVRVQDLIASFDWLASRLGGPDGQKMIGRTHGQYAVPMAAEHRWAVLFGMLREARNELVRDGWQVELGKMSGPVGDGIDSGELLDLGLRGAICSQIVPRDRLARWAQLLARFATICEATATQVWLLAQQDVGEVIERQTAGQVGSSAMPAKRNPVRSENIRGLARLARGYADMLQLGVVQWGEHDLAHSSVERVALPDLCHVVCTILSRTTSLLNNLEFRKLGQMPADYINTHELMMSLQRNGASYVEAHDEVSSGTYPDGKIPEDAPRVACGNPDEYCGAKGGSARCGGCKE